MLLAWRLQTHFPSNGEEERTMTRYAEILPVLALGLVLGGVQAGDPVTSTALAPDRLAQAKLEAARKTFESVWASRNYRQVETPYQWSCRWLEAQLQVGDKKEDKVAAHQQHLKRMQELERLTQQQYQQQILGITQVHAARYYVVEAEESLAQAKK
jgi:hypothetical protein